MSDSPQLSIPNTPDGESDNNGFSQRRVRHITSIQVRNLTPFPVRDAFASALLQPAEQSQFTTYGHLSDDLDVTLSRKRSRRISLNSITTHRSLKSDEGAVEDLGNGVGAAESRGRRRTASRVSLSSGGSLGRSGASSAGHPYSTSGSAPTVRPVHRPRTSSIPSSVNSPFTGPSFSTSMFSGPSSSTAPVPFSAMLPDNSQTGLEKVVKSRLVQTFLAITVPPSSTPSECLSDPGSQSAVITRKSSSHSRPSTPPRTASSFVEKPLISPQPVKQANSTTTTRKGSRPSPLNSSDKAVTPFRREPSASPRLFPQKPTSTHAKSPSASTLWPNGKVSAPSPSASSQKISAPLSTSSVQPGSKFSPPMPLQSIPNYLSPIHRPSTNPSFPIDARSKHEFADWTDSSAEKLKVEVWGKVGSGWRSDGNVNGKGKERERGHPDAEGGEDGVDWKMLEEWNIHLADLVPLPKDLISNPSNLPSNTLLVTLSPPGQTFYLPSSHASHSRSPTPSVGYTSDPESEVRKIKQGSDHLLAAAGLSGPAVDVVALSRRRHRRGAGVTSESTRDTAKTAGWQDLFKLITLQSCIIDNVGSLSDIVREIDKVMENDLTFALKREVSERESWVEGLRADNEQVKARSEKLKIELKARRERLDQRRETLALAREQHNEALASDAERKAEVSEQRTRLLSLRARFTPTRTTLLSNLSMIFPIDLFSPPDLLYTILDVPLPIPLSSTDPAPPLTLPAHSNVNEDAVATSLGYAAQVVQLLAAYLGKGLVYPVTCVGSRSLIRDGISAMVGPRMFPLFSRGVDTYRFEYGVFLLNKDIELLMADRDLRALDMRHTLPNLKNLLLTLTDGEGARLNFPRSLNSPISSVSSGLESPRAGSPLELNPSTSKPKINLELPVEDSTPPASGSTTPTAETDASKKTRPFLGLSPLAGFLRSRYPSAIRPSVKTVTEAPEGPQENGDIPATPPSQDSGEQDESGEDDEDRRTIRGVVLDRNEDQEHEGKNVVNGRGHENGSGEPLQREKHGDVSLKFATPPPPVTHVS